MVRPYEVHTVDTQNRLPCPRGGAPGFRETPIAIQRPASPIRDGRLLSGPRVWHSMNAAYCPPTTSHDKHGEWLSLMADTRKAVHLVSPSAPGGDQTDSRIQQPEVLSLNPMVTRMMCQSGELFVPPLRPSPPASAKELGPQFLESVRAVPHVAAIGIEELDGAFRITTIIDEFDMDVCERVFSCEALLYRVFPDLEADFVVLARDEARADQVLQGIAQEFLWVRADM